jgi:hypothetical protein
MSAKSTISKRHMRRFHRQRPPQPPAWRARAAQAGLPQWIRPQLTELVDAAPEGDQWLHEIKFDGYRMHARLDRGDCGC